MAVIPFILNPIVDIFLFSVILSIIFGFSNKILVNQEEAKNVRKRIKEINKEMKKHKGDQKKSSNLMSEYMQNTRKMMKMTLKPLAVSLVIVIISFPIVEDSYRKTVFISDGPENLELGKEYQISVNSGNISVSGIGSCAIPCELEIDGKNYNIDYSKSYVFFTNESNVAFSEIIVIYPIPLPLVNESSGWLAWYIIVILPATIIVRKMLRINA